MSQTVQDTKTSYVFVYPAIPLLRHQFLQQCHNSAQKHDAKAQLGLKVILLVQFML